MDRRHLLKLAAGSGLAAGVSIGMGGLTPAARAQAFPDSGRFQPVLSDPGRVIRAVAGLRPYRETGYVVRAERFDRRKTLIHHYGHGGAGITMSWGTAAEALRVQLEATSERSVAVIGCGVIGLTTALTLIRRGMDVTIYAAEMPPYTTSNIAAGIWGPSSLYRAPAVDDAFVGRFRAAARFSQRRFQHFVNDPRYGVRWVREYQFSRRAPSGPSRPGPLSALYPGLRTHARPGDWFGYPSVDEYWNLMIDPDIYLRALVQDFEIAGGRISLTRFGDPGEISRLDQRVIVNCAGLGARALFGDDDLRPMRGHLVYLLPQPEIDYAYVTGTEDGTLYMFPRRSALVLGGTNELDEWSTDPDPDQVARIVTGHRDIARRIAGGA